MADVFERRTGAVVAAGLIVGFGVADVTGVRPLGGLVLIAAALIAAQQWLPLRGPRVTAGLLLLFFAVFVLSHPLGKQIGAWPSVLLVAALAGGVTWLVADRPARAPA